MSTCFVIQGLGRKTEGVDSRVLDLDLDASYAVIKAAVQDCGMQCLRADETRHGGGVGVAMVRQLLDADLVIADLSTHNLNAAFELGVRYGLRPDATLIVAEEDFEPAFDVTHVVLNRRRRPGEDIGRKEADRFQNALHERIAAILRAPQADDAVPTFVASRLTGEPNAQSASKWLLDSVRAHMTAGDFGAARMLLQSFDPDQSNDLETLALWGAVHRRLWDIEGDPEALDNSLRAYARGHLLQQDHSTGVHFACLLEQRALRLAQAGERDDAIADRVIARRAREDVLRRLQPQLRDEAIREIHPHEAYGLLAAAWEALVGLGRIDDADTTRARALAQQPHPWMLQATEAQVVRIRDTQARLALALAAAPPRR
jgi:hypothetical protein